MAPNIHLSKNLLFFLSLFLSNFIFFSAVAAQAADPTYRVVRTIPAGGDGGWDYLTVDASAQRLYVSRSTRVAVLNADSGAPIGEIPNTEGVHGIALAADLGRGFTSNQLGFLQLGTRRRSGDCRPPEQCRARGVSAPALPR